MIKPQHRIFAIFFLFAFGLGSLLSRLADIQVQLGIQEGQLGLALMCSSLGMLVFLTLGAPLVEKIGTKRTFIIGNIAMISLYILVAGSSVYWVVIATILMGGMAVGAMEISINVEADRLEAHIGRRIMNRCHGFWSFGFFAAALLGGFMRQFDVSPFMHMIVVFPIVALGTIGAVIGQEMAPEKPDASAEKPGIFTKPTPFILALCAVSFGALIAEGAGIDWSVIYMRDSFEIAEFVESSSLIAFTLVMALTRFFADPVVEKFGTVLMARISIGITIVGVSLVGIAPTFWLAILGFMLLGMGSSIIYPLAVSAAARRQDRPASINVASLAQTAFLVFFIGPASLGFIAESFGIRMALMAPLPLLVLGLAFAGILDESRFPSAKKSIKLD
ncbi:MFS transporter [Maritalea porphyrae]|uniref:MFS transporter n=1 Tax=Maritalea porphyrae TaxID=880732 RepID=UPI0022AFB381|nr:MFS transporter [Maritalea porphyrae]MCZ4272139.1 MFS transporter [Maritalea porphyrae]